MVKLKSLRVWELDIDCGSSLMLELKKNVKRLMLQTWGIKIKPKPLVKYQFKSRSFSRNSM
jgi:hypothetical protein